MPRARTRRLTREELQSIVAGSPHPIVILSRDGRIRYACPSLAQLLGRAHGEVEPLTDLAHEGEEATLRRGIGQALDEEATSGFELRLRHADGSWLTFAATTRPLAPGAGGDSVALHLAERAGEDAPAGWAGAGGLPSRGVLLERLQRSLRRTGRQDDYGFALMSLEPDGLPLVSAGLGAGHVEELLEALGRRLSTSVRPGDLVARTGSDEFVILVDHVPGVMEATHVASRVREGLNRPFDLGGQEVFTTASIGITLSEARYERAHDMLRDAQVAMNRARARGGDRYELFDKTMHARARDRIRLEADLRRAVDRREFRVHYQPIISLSTGRIAGFEALARWQHPERGLLPPAEFIPLAEETGLIMPMSSQVFLEASSQVKAWQVEFEWDPPLKISMNFTSTQFTESEVESTIIAAFKSAGLEGSQVIAEITESVMIRDVESVRTVLEGLKVFGIEIHVDDFGTGYSSLRYLHRLPVDALKVDRSFVGRLPEDEDADVLVRTIVDLGHHLGMQVVAEGIETRTQLERLRELGCEFGQGFLLAKPMPRDAAGKLLAKDPVW